ncbi:MAG: ABC transporter substrate-binding protein [Bacteroidaceae bacterium]|nr:ABC transporter substrate-binding protein [Bacteroidaceae bacterium]
MKKIPYFNIIFISICLFVYSCNNKTNKKNIDTSAISIALLPTMDNIPFYYADTMGIFDSLGLKIKLNTYESAMDCDTAFKNGKADGIISDIVKANIWRSNGDSIKIIMSTDLRLYLITAYSARIKQISSLKEKIIAITRNSAVDYFADRIMDSAKLERWELNKPQINNLSLRCKMVNNNQFDGAILPEPYATASVAHRGTRHISAYQLCGNNSAVVFNDSTIKLKKDEIKKLVIGYNIAVQKLNKITEAGKENILEYLPYNTKEQIPDSILSFQKYNLASMPSQKTIYNTAIWAKNRQLIKKMAQYDELIDSTFLKIK